MINAANRYELRSATPKREGQGSQPRRVDFTSSQEEIEQVSNASILEQLENTHVSPIISDLVLWQTLGETMTMEQLTSRITKAPWFARFIADLQENIVYLTGCPQSGKSSLAVNMAHSLGMQRVKTSSRNFWLYVRDVQPRFAM